MAGRRRGGGGWGGCHTLDVGRVVDDEGAVPHHGEVDREVADVAALVVVLRREEGKQTIKRWESVYSQRIPSCLRGDAAINPHSLKQTHFTNTQ